MPDNPLVSIVVPTRDRAELVQETVASVAAQDYSNWELIVIDDRSSDDTVVTLQEIARSDSRVLVKRREATSPGAPSCRNEGASLARGEYLIFLDSDDLLAPACLSGRLSALHDHSDLDFIVFQTELFQKQPGDQALLWNAHTDENDLDRFLRLDTPWSATGPIYRREYWDKSGGWDRRLVCWQDWELHSRLVASHARYLKIPVADSYYRRMNSGRVSIGASGVSPECLESTQVAIYSLIDLLRASGQFGGRRPFYASELLLRVAYLYALDRDLDSARQVLCTMRDRNLISTRRMNDAWLWTRTRNSRIVRRLATAYYATRWGGKPFRRVGSDTYLNAAPSAPIEIDDSGS